MPGTSTSDRDRAIHAQRDFLGPRAAIRRDQITAETMRGVLAAYAAALGDPEMTRFWQRDANAEHAAVSARGHLETFSMTEWAFGNPAHPHCQLILRGHTGDPELAQIVMDPHDDDPFTGYPEASLQLIRRFNLLANGYVNSLNATRPTRIAGSEIALALGNTRHLTGMMLNWFANVIRNVTAGAIATNGVITAAPDELPGWQFAAEVVQDTVSRPNRRLIVVRFIAPDQEAWNLAWILTSNSTGYNANGTGVRKAPHWTNREIRFYLPADNDPATV